MQTYRARLRCTTWLQVERESEKSPLERSTALAGRCVISGQDKYELLGRDGFISSVKEAQQIDSSNGLHLITPKRLAQGKISFALDYTFVKIRCGNEPQLLAALRSRKAL